MNATYLPSCVENNGVLEMYPHKLTLKLQEEKSRDIHDKVVEHKINRSIAIKIIKPLNLNSDAIKLILDNAFMKQELC